jgi:hypothetical protein
MYMAQLAPGFYSRLDAVERPADGERKKNFLPAGMGPLGFGMW